MVSCPYCNAGVVEDLNFCIECENQIRCLSCESLLYKGKSRCLKCGEGLKEIATSKSEMNSYTLERKATRYSSSERIEIKASDSAVGALMGKVPFGSNTPLQPLNLKETPLTPPALPSEREKTISLEAEAQSGGESDYQGKSLPFLTADSLFNKHSDSDIVPSKTLRDYIQKLASKKEKQQTLITMLVWAYGRIYGENISHEKLVDAMRQENLYDTNTRKYLPEVARSYFKTVDDRYEINLYDGEKRVSEIIQAIQSPDITDTAAGTKKTGKRGRPPGSLNAKEVEAVKPWLNKLPENFKKFDARQLTSAADWGAFGLYVLTKVLEVDEAIGVGLVYIYLIKQFPVMTISREAFVKRIGDSRSKRFRKNAGGNYFLTPEAEAQVKKMIETTSSS